MSAPRTVFAVILLLPLFFSMKPEGRFTDYEKKKILVVNSIVRVQSEAEVGEM